MSNHVNQNNDEQVDFSTLLNSAENFQYARPRWLLNDNVYDQEWLASQVAIDIEFFRNNKDKALKINFNKKVSDKETLTDQINEP
jgi:hypothetical protein